MTRPNSELEYQLMLAKDLTFLSYSDFSKLFEETIQVKRMLAADLSKLMVDRPQLISNFQPLMAYLD